MNDYRKDFKSFQKEYFWTLPRLFLMGAVVLVPLVVGGLYFEAFRMPFMESVRRDTMIQSRAYSEATTRQMYRLMLQYKQAKTDDEKDTIKSFIRHEVQAFDRSRLPSDVKVFLEQNGI